MRESVCGIKTACKRHVERRFSEIDLDRFGCAIAQDQKPNTKVCYPTIILNHMKHYWYQPDAQHDCKKLGCGELEPWEIIEMQTIDADCNDCLHFKRGHIVKEIE